jgi:medium-chain acyl-[acyl-carrier-protein] hydrolase
MKKSSDAPSQWLVPFGTDFEGQARLVCIPHAGGGAVTFHPWAKSLRPHVEVYAAQLPGRENRLRETPLRTLAAVVEPLTAAISSLADRPLVVFGHSFGAVLAFEVVRRLCEHPETRVAALLVSGRPAPHLPSRAPRLAHLSLPDVVSGIAKLYGNIPAPLLNEPEFVSMLGKVLQADLEILERYQPAQRTPVPCRIAVYGGTDDSLVSRGELEAWREHTTGAFSCTQFAGDHFYFKTQAGQQSLLDSIRECCAAAARCSDTASAAD